MCSKNSLHRSIVNSQANGERGRLSDPEARRPPQYLPDEKEATPAVCDPSLPPPAPQRAQSLAPTNKRPQIQVRRDQTEARILQWPGRATHQRGPLESRAKGRKGKPVSVCCPGFR